MCIRTSHRGFHSRLVDSAAGFLLSEAEFERFYNGHRHQGIANVRPLHPLPAPPTDPGCIARLDIRRHDRLGGTLHE
jgi:hypothetical protein